MSENVTEKRFCFWQITFLTHQDKLQLQIFRKNGQFFINSETQRLVQNVILKLEKINMVNMMFFC